jgi:hypothetical protein
MLGPGLGFAVFCLIPGFFGWIIGLTVSLALLLTKPRPGIGSWIAVLFAQVIGLVTLVLVGRFFLGGEEVSISPPAMATLSFVLTITFSTVPAVGLRYAADRRSRPNL